MLHISVEMKGMMTMLNVVIRSKLSNFFTEEEITKSFNLAPKYIKHYYNVGKQVFWDYRKMIKIILFLILLRYAANWCGEQSIQLNNTKVLKDFILQNQAAILIIGNILINIAKLTYALLNLVSFVISIAVGIRFVTYLYTKPFFAMTDQEHIDLISKLKSVGIRGKHNNGFLEYDWDEVLNVLYEKFIEDKDYLLNQSYQKIQKHYYYLRSASIKIFDLGS